jgi:hypothetical protein
MDVSRAELIYGSDDRKEVFEGSIQDRDLAASSVAFLPREVIERATGALVPQVPSLQNAGLLCPGVPFNDQPAAATCSGVLVDFDLVLTAAHCVHAEDLSRSLAVFGYFYTEPDRLRMTRDDAFEIVEVVNDRPDAAPAAGSVDFAWLRLARPAAPPWHPVRGVRGTALEAGESLTVVSASAGVPLKVDHGPTVVDAGADLRDVFLTNSDTFRGSSGAGAFDADGLLAGVLARGREDYVWTEAECYASVRETDAAAAEQYNYAQQALESLCQAAPAASSLCRAGCEPPCAALPRAMPDEAGCNLGRPLASRPVNVGALLVAVAVACLVALRRRLELRRSSC